MIYAYANRVSFSDNSRLYTACRFDPLRDSPVPQSLVKSNESIIVMNYDFLFSFVHILKIEKYRHYLNKTSYIIIILQ